MKTTYKKEPALVILAAGMGSRYGGLKQIDTVGSNGESIIDFSIYDAIEAGFKKVYLIIQKQHQAAFEKELGSKIRKHIDLEYVYQSLDDLPAGYKIPEGRQKPWGTSHALLSLRNQVKEAFIILNADDYYGKDAYKKMYDFLKNEISDDRFALMAYELEKTLSDSGSVTRGVCQVENGYLTNIVEVFNIIKDQGQAKYEVLGNWDDLDSQSLVSMNFWAFTPKIFELLKEGFIDFLDNKVKLDPLKAEALLPNDIDQLIKAEKIKVKVLSSQDLWFGVTYKEDKEKVVEKLALMKAENAYPFDLWK